MRRTTRLTLALVALFVAAISPAFADDSLKRVLAAKELRVGVALNAPWVIKRADGAYAGYDIDLTTALAQDLGVTPKFVEMPFRELVRRLAVGDVDIVASGLATTPERAKRVVFSDVTGAADIRTVAAIDAIHDDNVADLDKANVRIAVLAGSTDEAAAKLTYPHATIVSLPTAADALAALASGDAQAMVATAPVPELAARLYDAKLRLVGGALTRTPEAFALRPDDIRLQQFVDNWIDARMADGFIANVRDHWFSQFDWINQLGGDTGDAPPPAPTAK
ncbi:MAG: transporter substrate-binding domain-containing protein [Caulobacteraceae bacterium]|jgi:polar amino acid transport system substrate-binding protein